MTAFSHGPAAFAVTLALACGAAPAPAAAQVFFQPYARAFSYQLPSYDDDMGHYNHRSSGPRFEEDGGPYAYRRGPGRFADDVGFFATPRGVARVLGREGYRLAGPIKRRGDRVVALGQHPYSGARLFVIDAYEGEILSIRRVAPEPREFGGRLRPEDGPEAGPPADLRRGGAPRSEDALRAEPRRPPGRDLSNRGAAPLAPRRNSARAIEPPLPRAVAPTEPRRAVTPPPMPTPGQALAPSPEQRSVVAPTAPADMTGSVKPDAPLAQNPSAAEAAPPRAEQKPQVSVPPGGLGG